MDKKFWKADKNSKQSLRKFVQHEEFIQSSYKFYFIQVYTVYTKFIKSLYNHKERL